MTEWIRQWIIGITCGAMLCAVLQAFLPKGGLGKAGRLAGGLVLLIVTVQPLIGLDYDCLARTLTEYRLAESGYTGSLTEMSGSLLKEIIEEQTEAYILDKAEEIGFQCEAAVTYDWDETGVPYPSAVRIVSSATGEQEARLARVIEAELGVPAGSQVYERKVE